MGTEAAMLSGACTCGRNQYEILPITPSSAQVLFDDTLESRTSCPYFIGTALDSTLPRLIQ